MKPRILFLTTLLCAAIAGVQIVHAAEIIVINTNDSGAGSLRQALANANYGDTIIFSGTGTITLTTGQLEVNTSLTISGTPGSSLAVSGNHASTVFRIGAMPPQDTVTISNLTITNGTTSGNGGGIYNHLATLTVRNCILSGNSTTFGNGGGIYNDHGTLTIDSCTLNGNSVPLGDGGGIYNDHGTLTVNNSTLSGNSASAFGRGGGIENRGEDSGSATLTIINSTLSGNSARDGGGIRNTGQNSGSATLTIINSTLSGNSASFGGGIANAGFDGSATLTLGDTILNTGASGGNIFNDQGTVKSLGYNLSSDAAGGDATTGPGGRLNQPGDIRNTIPMLDPAGLQNNGGPTQTIALMPGSPAIDKGKNFSGSTLDQRGTGFVRTSDDPAIANAGDGTDIGAFEVQWTPTPAYAAQVQQPIDADGTSVFNVKRGVVPVKFTLTLDGATTCDLPPATIAVTQTEGDTTGPIDEPVYTGPADNGSFFRIDSCQYIYNLNASALGKGTYQVDIMINDQVVGSATFQLK